MATKLENEFRVNLVKDIKEYFESKGEDVGYIKSNIINMPCVIDGIERWVSISVSVAKIDQTMTAEENSDSGYIARQEYLDHIAEQKAKAEAKAEAKAKKIARDKALREKKKLEKAVK